MFFIIVPILASPDAILLDSCFGPAGQESHACACKKLFNVAFNHFVEFERFDLRISFDFDAEAVP